jgi:hypothetical protein
VSYNTFPQELEVTAYSGCKANERPLSFILDQRRLEVEKIVDRWYGMEHDYFKVQADNGRQYLLKWHRSSDCWYLEKTIEG